MTLLDWGMYFYAILAHAWALNLPGHFAALPLSVARVDNTLDATLSPWSVGLVSCAMSISY